MTAKERLAALADEVEREGTALLQASARLRTAGGTLTEAEACRYLARLIAARMLPGDPGVELESPASSPSVSN